MDATISGRYAVVICNEPAPPVIILRLRDHVITRARITAPLVPHAWSSQDFQRIYAGYERRLMRQASYIEDSARHIHHCDQLALFNRCRKA